MRPRGTTAIDSQPAGNLSQWHSGTYEGWIRQVGPYIEQQNARVQDSIRLLGCPADPRGPDYKVPAYGFTWYVGVYSNPSTTNNGILVDDSKLKTKFTVSIGAVADGTSNTIMLAERPPPADGQWGWWDSPCCIQDDISPVIGDRKIYSSGRHGNCPDPATYQLGQVTDNCPSMRFGPVTAKAATSAWPTAVFARFPIPPEMRTPQPRACSKPLPLGMAAKSLMATIKYSRYARSQTSAHESQDDEHRLSCSTMASAAELNIRKTWLNRSGDPRQDG